MIALIKIPFNTIRCVFQAIGLLVNIIIGLVIFVAGLGSIFWCIGGLLDGDIERAKQGAIVFVIANIVAMCSGGTKK